MECNNLRITDMAKFKFYTSVCDYGTIEVEADNLEEAKGLAYALDGVYFIHNTEILDIEIIKDYGDYGKV